MVKSRSKGKNIGEEKHMKFFALAFQYQEDVFYDFSKREDTTHLTETCFLPTEKMASDFISEELSEKYAVVEIELESLQPNGIWSYTRGEVKRWDEEYE